MERATGRCPEDCASSRVVTHIPCPEVGSVAVRLDVPPSPCYGDAAPIVVGLTWFVDKHDAEETPFHLVFNSVDIGAVAVSHLWPGKRDPETGIASTGSYRYGGPNSLAALRDTIRFALGDLVDSHGARLHELIDLEPLYNNVGLFASSHAGAVAINVMADHGEVFPDLKCFVGREDPTMAAIAARASDSPCPIRNRSISGDPGVREQPWVSLVPWAGFGRLRSACISGLCPHRCGDPHIALSAPSCAG